MSEFEEFITLLGELGASVLFLEQPPVLDIGDVSLPLYLSYKYDSLDIPSELLLSPLPNAVRDGSDRLRSFVKQYDFCQTIPIADLYEKSAQVIVCRENSILYIDDDHLSLAGTMIAKDRIKTSLEAALSDPEKITDESE